MKLKKDFFVIKIKISLFQEIGILKAKGEIVSLPVNEYKMLEENIQKKERKENRREKTVTKHSLTKE